MRWSDYRTDLTPEGLAHLVNLLTVGNGSIAFAVRLSSQDVAATQVLLYLGNAHDALRLAERTVSALLAPLRNGVTSLRWREIPDVDISWSALMARLSYGERQHVLECLGAAGRSARQASQIALVDGEIEEMRKNLQSAVDALGEVRFLLPALAE